MNTNENCSENNGLLSPSRLKFPSKFSLGAQPTSLIPKPSLTNPNNGAISLTSAAPAIQDQSQILLSPQFKSRKYTNDSMTSSSLSVSNLLPTNQIQVGLKVNDISSLASYVEPSSIKTKPTSYPIPQPPILLSSKNKRAKWDTKVT